MAKINDENIEFTPQIDDGMTAEDYFKKRISGTRLAVEMLEAMEVAGKRLADVTRFGFRAELEPSDEPISKNGYLQFDLTGRMFYSVHFADKTHIRGEYVTLN